MENQLIISHKNKFVFLKPLKVGGSSVEVSLIPHCDDKDIVTGTAYENELNSEYDYQPRNNFKIVDVKKQLVDGENVNFITAEPLYHSHANLHNIDSTLRQVTKDYFKFTIIRNPWDTLVSYFWWSFYQPKFIGEDKIKRVYEKSQVPLKSDPDIVLRMKFQNFIETTKFSIFDLVGSKSQQGTFISDFLNFQKKFYEDVDHIIKFENLQADYNTTCKLLGWQPEELLRLKNTIRKSKKQYQIYYSDYAKNLVKDSFGDLIERFEYKF